MGQLTWVFRGHLNPFINIFFVWQHLYTYGYRSGAIFTKASQLCDRTNLLSCIQWTIGCVQSHNRFTWSQSCKGFVDMAPGLVGFIKSLNFAVFLFGLNHENRKILFSWPFLTRWKLPRLRDGVPGQVIWPYQYYPYSQGVSLFSGSFIAFLSALLRPWLCFTRQSMAKAHSTSQYQR
jgi:hypothetical protein